MSDEEASDCKVDHRSEMARFFNFWAQIDAKNERDRAQNIGTVNIWRFHRKKLKFFIKNSQIYIKMKFYKKITFFRKIHRFSKFLKSAEKLHIFLQFF